MIQEKENINIDANKVYNNRDDQVKFLSEQLNIIFTRAHLDGIKIVLNAMKSSVSVSLREFVDKIENSLKLKLTEHDNNLIESYIHDYLTSLNDNQLKNVYERLAQQGTLKRLTIFGELNQSITMGLMKKIHTDGLSAVIENMKEAHLDNDTMNKLIQALTHINHHIQTQSSVSLEQMQNQLDMAYFIETRNLNEQDIHELSKAVDLYSIAHIPLAEEATKNECSDFLEHLKAPFIRICIQRILNLINQENTIDLDKVSNKFYNERIIDLFNELIYGSDEFNQNLLFHQIKELLKKNKELPDKLYRQMLREKLIQIDTKIKIDTDKKKVSMIIEGINRILINEKDRIKQEQLIELFDRIDIPVPERIKRWYKRKSNTPNLQFSSSKIKKDMIKRKNNVKTQIKMSPSKTKSVTPIVFPSTRRATNKSEQITQKTKEQLQTTTAVTSSKRSSERKASLVKSWPKTQSTLHEGKKQRKIHDNTRKTSNASIDKNEKMKVKINSQISVTSKSKDQQKNTLDVSYVQPDISPSTTMTTDAFSIDDISKFQVEREDDFIDHSSSSIAPSQTTKEQLLDHQLPDSVYTITKSNQNTELSQNTSTDVQIDTEVQVKKDFDSSQQPEDIHEDYFEKDDKSSAPQKDEIFRGDLETIRSEATTDGKMGENKILNFELNHAVAPLLYYLSLLSDPKQEISTSLSGRTAEFVNDLPYEKTKAQRILAKTMTTNIGHQHIERDTIGTSSSSTILPISNSETISAPTETGKLSDPPIRPVDESSDNTKTSTKVPRRTLSKSLKQTDDIYMNSLTTALHSLFTESKYDSTKLRKIHEELISSGHISPLNEFYRSTNEALRVTLDHCITYDEFIKWTLSLLQTNNKPNLIDFGHDLYSIAIDLDLTLIDRIDNTRCAIEIQENLKHELQTITENDLREINSYINAAQLEKVVNISKKLNVSSKDRMISDLYSLLLHLIQACHTFEPKYRPMQTYIREISETFKSRAVADLARKMDEIEKNLSKNFGITFFGVSKRLNESRFILIK